ncbi:arsenate reductase (glutaredoxin) [Suttonella sp. R2A3]|uniref:ArsC/Spx/MgsR family protein n=1 Tax=Suttonella sp. R2A3 TaxID=2908648 RepID=UPI001F455295|nr:ArsC/Spx/MgsR family protein [Suttonella sp. R2A3]UJF24550.1 arsenate reductase (glutaredoxin) [Suttonella sp. R2A3]
MSITIYHNPRCSKSRAALAYLQEHDFSPIVLEYLQDAPDEPTLRALAAQVPGGASSLIRAKDAKVLGITAQDDEAVIATLAAHPELIERPIVVTPLGVRLGRPLENIYEILPR